MEALAPIYVAIVEVRSLLENGDSLLQGLKRVSENTSGELRWQFHQFLLGFERGEQAPHRVLSMSFLRKEFFGLLERGLKGEPILEPMKALEEQCLADCHQQIHRFLNTIGFKTMFPVLFFLLPAYLLLLLGPFLEDLLKSI